MKELSEVIRDLREDHDLTQKDVANYLGISQQCYSGYERGRCEVPTWVVTALTKMYQVSADYILGAETDYLGSTNLANIYYEDTTMYDVVYDIQKIRKDKRQQLLSYIKFLNSDEA